MDANEGLPLAISELNIISGRLEDPNNGWKEFLIVEKMDPEALIPVKATPGSAGYDLFAFEPAVIPAWGQALVSTKLKIRIPNNCYGRIASRSGLSVNNGIEVGAGVIDMDYQGEIKVVLRNFSDSAFNVPRGKAVAQLILERCAYLPIKVISKLTDIFGITERGQKGFGSSS